MPLQRVLWRGSGSLSVGTAPGRWVLGTTTVEAGPSLTCGREDDLHVTAHWLTLHTWPGRTSGICSMKIFRLLSLPPWEESRRGPHTRGGGAFCPTRGKPVSPLCLSTSSVTRSCYGDSRVLSVRRAMIQHQACISLLPMFRLQPSKLLCPLTWFPHFF